MSDNAWCYGIEVVAMILRSVAVGVLLSACCGCLGVEDQWFSPGSSEWKTVNPDFSITVPGRHKVLIGVFDSGVDYTHPALVPAMHYNDSELHGRAGLDDDGNGFVDDFLGYDFTGMDGFPFYAVFLKSTGTRDRRAEKFYLAHGTHVSGIAVRGCADIGIVPYRVLPVSKNSATLRRDGPAATDDAALLREGIGYLQRAVEHAVAWNRTKGPMIRVINISIMYMPDDSLGIPLALVKKYFAPLEKLMRTEAREILFVAAAGNDKKDISAAAARYPCQINAPNVLCVGAVDDSGALTDFSNFGLKFIDIFAPGQDILSAVPVETADDPKNAFDTDSGTSMASPFVARVAARMFAVNPSLGVAGAVRIIKRTAARRIAPVQAGHMKKPRYHYRVVDEARAVAGVL